MSLQNIEFGKYRLIERIAVGGTAEVFRALALRPTGDVPVVLKRVLPQHARDPRFAELFREEALVVAKLEHPKIVRLFDFGEMQGTFFLALEYVDGADVATLVDQANRLGDRLGPAHAARIAADVSEALHYLHTRTSDSGLALRMVHRDVSPQNILVSRAGDVKLADFGIAQSVIRSDKTVDGMIKGKLLYMSPEQARGQRDLGPATDIFALGAVLYEMLFGEAALAGGNDVETLERARRADVRLDERRLPAEHRLLLPVLRRCLEREPGARYPSAHALGQDLVGYLAQAPPADTPLGERVEHLLRASDRGVDDIASSLLGGGFGGGLGAGIGGTAVLAAQPSRQGRSAAERAADMASASEKPAAALARFSAGASPHGPRLGPPRAGAPRFGPRVKVALLLVLVVPLTVVATLLLARRAPAPAPSPSATPPLAAKAVADSAASTPDAASSSKPASPPTAHSAPAALSMPAALSKPAVRLTLRSRPRGAALRIDGASIGRAPQIISAPTRPFVVEARHQGYATWRRRIEPPRANRAVDIVLAPRQRLHGRLTVNSIPWARVSVDGRSVGITPIRALRLRVGRHRVVLRDARGRRLRAFVTRIGSGQTRVYSFDQSKR